ncbi:3-isopropylmalate dehydratase small subunit [Cupriavidus sp. AU9028]|uniref:3-isopropylmalate dehydratase small subunit n=1 Tax=Cupriavidus sp. AU9028 TaxID=2871157 RepID=UPI001C97FD8A|nr:3-isopropylmalate dehydratase small subunit [Cupriavidus sp. AU9028]MBY4897007.1 3-isopropylmalate dehydratase small subunit [Cupriavidus sp. AU9028]
MSESLRIEGRAAALRIENLDTDQIMPKQFLRGIDKSGLAQGLLYDLRFDPQGNPRPSFVLNQPTFADTRILIGGANFGCGSSREHAVWGLLQYGVRAVIAPSFGEIFYSNAMNNRLLLVMLPPEQVAAMMDDVERHGGGPVSIDLEAMRVRSPSVEASFTISPRHHDMFRLGVDVIGLSLEYRQQIEVFARQRCEAEPWCRGVAALTRERLGRT